MINEFRLPNITAANDSGKLVQMQSYLYQLVEQLNWAMKNVGSTDLPASTAAGQSTKTSAQQSVAEAQATFNSIKSLIAKSAEIVNAYYDKISARLDGVYVAESDFGIYVEQTSQEITANSTAIEQFYTDLQQIITDIETDISEISVNAHIRSGKLYSKDDGTPVFGLEIGQRTELDGVETFNKYAQFTADKLAFFDQNGYEVAYISDRKLFITEVEITGAQIMGGFKRMVVPGKGVVTKWIGG